VENLGSRMKFYREQLGLSQLELSQKSDVSQASIARIEAGKQLNLKRDTIKKLTDALGISLSELMEFPSFVKEEKASYNITRMVPVFKPKTIESIKNFKSLNIKTNRYEPSFSPDNNAFYILITPELTSEPIIDVEDLILIEPSDRIREKDMVFYLSSKKIGIGIIHYHPESFIIQPLEQSMPPLLFKKAEKKHRITIFRISEIKKKKY
jgi:transcriptional regulator with XRE-family HTH domain